MALTDEDHQQAVPPQAEGFVAAMALVLAAFLIGIAPLVTRPQPADKAWFMAPMNGPVFSLIIMAVPAAFMVWRWWKARNAPLFWQNSAWAFGDFVSAIEYGLYFCVYLWIINYLGFALSTLLFGQICLARSGLRSPGWVVANITFTAVLVVLLRVILGLWFPMAILFKFLPPGIGNTLGAIL